jgi:hypothetical protein
VIPYIDAITDVLDTVADDGNLFAVVRMAASNARKIVDKYYAKTDDSIVYRNAMRESSASSCCTR